MRKGRGTSLKGTHLGLVGTEAAGLQKCSICWEHQLISNYIESTLGPAAQLLWNNPSVHWAYVLILIATKELTG